VVWHASGQKKAEFNIMRIAVSVGWIAFGLAAVQASAQTAPPPTPQNPGTASGPLGGFRAPSNDPGAGLAESPGAFVGPSTSSKGGTLKGEYGLDLARRIADAQRLVEDVAKGRVLTDSDSRHIRNLLREDFIAWRKQFDPLPSAYREVRDRWIVDEKALQPGEWARQRLDWLQSQRDWIVSSGG
jgi:hypothetical protein